MNELKGPSLTIDLSYRSPDNEFDALAAIYDIEFSPWRVVLVIGGKTNLFIPLRFF